MSKRNTAKKGGPNTMTRAVKADINRRLNGVVLTLGADPPRVVQIPWNSIVVRFQGTSAAGAALEYRISDLCTTLTSQLELDCSTDIELRVQRMAAWETSGQSFTVEPYSLASGLPSGTSGPKTMTVLHDNAGRNQFARVGYVWPQSHQTVVYSRSEDPTIPVYRYELQPMSSFETHIHILWRTRGDPGAPRTYGGLDVKLGR